MHTSLPRWLALSAAILPTATAFYPYHYGDDRTSTSSEHSRRRPQLSNVDTNALSVTLPLRRIPAGLRSRQNAYNIANSNDPKQENSVAVDQDGGDLSYMVAVTFGDSKEEYHLLLDSAASNTWVMGQDCSTEACKTHTTFGKGDSSTLQTDAKTFSVTYGTGSSSGTLATDTLHVGSLSSTLTFGLATNVSDEFRSYPMDGILGIGRGSGAQGSIAAPQIMDVLSTNHLISAKLYGIHLSRSQDGLLDGELNLGEVNKDRFTGDLNYIPCVENSSGFWEIPIEDAGVDGKPVGLTGRTAIIDTGTSYILMPQPDAEAIHKQILGFKQDGETFFVPCDTPSIVQFTFNNHAYNISTADWRGGKVDGGLCRSNIVGRQTFSATQWLVGDVFLKNVYSVFDFDGSRVGLGVKGREEVMESSTSATASGESTRSFTPGSGPSTATMAGSDMTSAGAFSASASKTLSSASGSAGPASAAETQTQGQQGGAEGKTSAPLLAFLVAFATLSMFI
ncbi:acid protease [Clathrospora elynae]|uniref:Acid protease n=1 Tax=Clathrospora elynae TaxID=706981 RepID=A0A6A5T2C8_9PLEO|nr:acid protease [Clathrospora elynae]